MRYNDNKLTFLNNERGWGVRDNGDLLLFKKGVIPGQPEKTIEGPLRVFFYDANGDGIVQEGQGDGYYPYAVYAP